MKGNVEEAVAAGAHALFPVSYTHLDVYKRQPHHRFLDMRKIHHHTILVQNLGTTINEGRL